MLARVFSGAIVGVDAYTVDIEVNAGHGDPLIVIVGLPDAAVKEAKDRVFTALLNSGFQPPLGRTTVNLAPAHIKKEGPSFDLPIALGMLAANDDIPPDALAAYAVAGELALSGKVRRIRGVLPIALQARKDGRKGLMIPADNAEEAAIVDGLPVFPVSNLRSAAEFLCGRNPIAPFQMDARSIFAAHSLSHDDFSDVKGQHFAKRAIEIGVAGGHNILLIGPPGTGKSMLAKRVPSILPPMTLEEALETTKIHSIAGSLPAHQALVAIRPFRAPHHTISDAGLLGGGSHPMPGEASLAHNGVLFLDELPEFDRNVLEVMRQPLEEGKVAIVRANASVTFPCRFMLVAAMNPCPCGHYGDRKRECRCTGIQVQRYRNKISGPLLDRIDMHVEVPAIPYEQLATAARGESSSAIRERVIHARHVQGKRFRDDPHIYCNAMMGSREIHRHGQVTPEAEHILQLAGTEQGFSARTYDRLLKVARTIADLVDDDCIREPHIYEAIQFRALDRQYWT